MPPFSFEETVREIPCKIEGSLSPLFKKLPHDLQIGEIILKSAAIYFRQNRAIPPE